VWGGGGERERERERENIKPIYKECLNLLEFCSLNCTVLPVCGSLILAMCHEGILLNKQYELDAASTYTC